VPAAEQVAAARDTQSLARRAAAELRRCARRETSRLSHRERAVAFMCGVMCMTKICLPRVAFILVALSLVACSERFELSADTLGRAVRDAGFPCEGAVGATELKGDIWRVGCGGGSTYIASVLESGDICVDPMPIGDVGPVFQELDENRCAPNVKAH
jgi:hypothetical protein